MRVGNKVFEFKNLRTGRKVTIESSVAVIFDAFGNRIKSVRVRGAWRLESVEAFCYCSVAVIFSKACEWEWARVGASVSQARSSVFWLSFERARARQVASEPPVY